MEWEFQPCNEKKGVPEVARDGGKLNFVEIGEYLCVHEATGQGVDAGGWDNERKWEELVFVPMAPDPNGPYMPVLIRAKLKAEPGKKPHEFRVYLVFIGEKDKNGNRKIRVRRADREGPGFGDANEGEFEAKDTGTGGD